MPFNHGYELTWETVAHALTKGLQLRTRGRLVEPTALTMAQNVEYPVTGGVQKRRGHLATRTKLVPKVTITPPVTDTSTLNFAPFTEKVLPATWLPGFGTTEVDHRIDHTAHGIDASTLASHSQLNLGGLELNNNPIVWTGDQLVNSEGGVTPPVLMPMARQQPVPPEGVNAKDTQCARTRSGRYVVVAPVNNGTDKIMRIQCYSANDELIVSTDLAFAVGNAFYHLRVVPKKDDVWIFYQNAVDGTLKVIKVTNCDTIAASVTVVTGAWGAIDVALVPATTNTTDAYVAYRTFTGVSVSSLDEDMVVTGTIALALAPGLPRFAVAVDVHQNQNVAVACIYAAGLASPALIYVEMFDADLTVSLGSDSDPLMPAVGPAITEQLNYLDTYPAQGQPLISQFHAVFSNLAIGFRALKDSGADLEEVLDVWASSIVTYSGATTPRWCPFTTHSVFVRNSSTTALQVKDASYPLPFFSVAGRAMSVGATPVVPLQWHGLYGSRVWSSDMEYATDFSPPVQPTLLLLGAHNCPVGKFNASNAYSTYQGFYPIWPGNYVYTGCVVAATKPQPLRAEQNQQRLPLLNYYVDPVASIVDLDFIHPLSSANLGKSAFIAGAQVWEYDGVNLTEAGFHLAPEFDFYDLGAVPLAPPFDVPEYWRIDLFDLSASGESTRSASIPFKATLTLLGGADNTWVWPPPTWRDTSFFAGFETTGGTLYMTTERDPLEHGVSNRNTFASFGSAVTISCTNRVNSVLSAQEIHPASTIGYLQPNSPPGCQVIRAGNNRLWFAGGAVPKGSVTASMLYQPGYLPGWNDANTQVISTPHDSITDMAFLQDSAFIFTKENVFLVNSPGPDNFGQGPQWPQPQQLTVGGTPYANTAVATSKGIFYLSNSGVQLINYAGGVSDVGDADPEMFANTIVAAVNFASKDQARWYSSDGDAVVLDYREGRFSTWTGLECATAFVAGERAYVVRTDGYLWREAYGADEYWTDGYASSYFIGFGETMITIPRAAGTPIEMVIRTAWNPMGTDKVGYGRCRRIAWTGEFRGDHSVRMRVFYNESAVHEDEYTLNWATQGALATSWGSEFWGFGAWGGTSEDKVWRWAWRPSRNKCSVIMFELSDLGADSAGFVPVCYGFEIGRHGGLDRVRMK